MKPRTGPAKAVLCPPRVVLDTNVVLSALVFSKGITASLRLAWAAGRFTPLASRETVQELVRVLAYPKFRLTAQEQHELLADYLPFAELVRIPARLPKVPACRDPLDLPFLHLAAAGKADAIVSGDRDLLEVSGWSRCPVLTPSAFLRSLSTSPLPE